MITCALPGSLDRRYKFQSFAYQYINQEAGQAISCPFHLSDSPPSKIRPARVPPTTAGQHLLDKYAQTHAGYHGPVEVRGSKATA